MGTKQSNFEENVPMHSAELGKPGTPFYIIDEATYMGMDSQELEELLDDLYAQLNRAEKAKAVFKAERDYFKAECGRLKRKCDLLEAEYDFLGDALADAQLDLKQMRNQLCQ